MLIPVELRAVEEISSLFEIDVEAVSHNAEIRFDDIVGTPASVELIHEKTSQRFLSGIVSTFAQSGTYDSTLGEMVRYQLKIVPWLWLLTLDSDCRVFEEKSVSEILEDVFDRRAGNEDFALDLTGTYSPRPYCVQYRERDFAFVSRLMEQEGISYCFEHGDGTHKLIAFDESGARPDASSESELVYSSDAGKERDQNEVSEWKVQQAVAPGRFALSGYDFTSPADDNQAAASSTLKIGGNSNREIFDYPPYYTSLDGDRYATVRIEELETASYRVHSRSQCMPLTAGTHVRLTGHYRKEFNNKRYLVTRVEHRISQSLGTDSTGTQYENSFQCLPEDIKYRTPTRTPSPTINGSQTALVVGPAGEEIHCDQHGRVRIQFPWDRHGQTDGSNVCWARTAQSLAGPKFGAIFTPRIGQEVVVNFVEGDPDRPVITGVVYNGNNLPPYALPENKTQSGFKTRSSKEGTAENFNEIRFEDKLGNEVFTIQAEKDLERLVKNDEQDEVGHDRTRDVGNDETVSIGANRTVSVAKDHSESISENETLEVGIDRTRSVMKNESVTIGEDQTISVSKVRSIDVGDDQKLSVAKSLDESIGKDHSITVAENYELQAKKISIEAKDEISITVGKAKIQMKKNGDISISGGKINVKGSKDVAIKGSKVKAN